MSEPLTPIRPNRPLEPARSRSGKRVLLVMLAIVVLGAIPAVVVPMMWQRGKPPKLVDMGALPSFKLTDERGNVFTEDAFRHQQTIVGFVFTRCDTICPVTSLKMENVQDQTFDVGKKVKLVSFSVDPEYDTPERLTAYAQRFKADPERWRFVTGPKTQVTQLVESGFMASMQREGDRPSGVPDIAHAAYFLLVDGDLHIRGRYDSNDVNEIAEMMRAARYLARISN